MLTNDRAMLQHNLIALILTSLASIVDEINPYWAQMSEPLTAAAAAAGP
jgi:hypothetical protein